MNRQLFAQLLKPSEAAELLGLGIDTTYRLIAKGAIPCVRIGRTIRIDADELARLIKGVPPAPAIEVKNIDYRSATPKPRSGS